MNLKFSNDKYIIDRTELDYMISILVSPNSIYFKVDEILCSPFYNNTWNKPSDDTNDLRNLNNC